MKTKEMKEPSEILVLGAYRQTLSVLRSLGARYPLVLGRIESQTYVDRSRFVSRTWQHPKLSPDNPEVFLESLQKFLAENPNVRTVFPVGDSEILFFSDLRERLPEGIQFIMTSKDVVDACQQKTEMFNRVIDLGIPTADFRSISKSDSLSDTADEVGYPCIIKPENETSRIFGKKAFIAVDRESLRQKLSAFATDPDGIPDESIVQKYCIGGRHNIYFFAERGSVLASTEVRIDRTDQWDGTGYAVEGHTVPADDKWAEHLSNVVADLDYHGAGCLQYLVDPATGESTFLEINARLGANFACVFDCGLDLPGWWVSQLVEEESEACKPPANFSYPVGKRYTWLYGDLLGLKKALGNGQVSASQAITWLGRLFLANVRSATHVTFRWNDPMPALVAMKELLGGPLRKLRSGSKAAETAATAGTG